MDGKWNSVANASWWHVKGFFGVFGLFANNFRASLAILGGVMKSQGMGGGFLDTILRHHMASLQ